MYLRQHPEIAEEMEGRIREAARAPMEFSHDGGPTAQDEEQAAESVAEGQAAEAQSVTEEQAAETVTVIDGQAPLV